MMYGCLPTGSQSFSFPSCWMPKLREGTKHKSMKDGGMIQGGNHGFSKVKRTHLGPLWYGMHVFTKWDSEVGEGQHRRRFKHLQLWEPCG